MSDMVKPVHYQLEITPDLEQFRFSGKVCIALEAAQAVAEVALNLLELAVWQCRFKTDDQWRPCAFSVDPAHEALTVTLPQPVEGRFELAIDYEGRINDKMAGFYRSAFQKEGHTRYIAVTQFQESAARQAFPCLDHPRYKATFDLTLTVPEGLQAIANMPPREEKITEAGVRRIIFERTPIMSTYLLFFGVGEFEIAHDMTDPRVRVITLPGLQHTTGLGLAFGRTALKFCEQFYGIDYPLTKLDLIAVPDFAFGAMENWGAITFRENLLLHFAETTSVEGVERICEVIAHEIAHQWFGNLVTPSDWKYLWLNESFATYFGYGVVADAHPDWGTWDQFLHSQTATAMVRDGLQATFPIELPGGGQVIINASTAPIIYNKGASMLRMVEGHIGPERYQKGVRAYLNRHAYSCAESRDLWEAFESAAEMPVTEMVQNWIGQPGYPLVTARRHETVLQLSQQRFTYLPQESRQSWQIPVKLVYWTRGGESRELALLFAEPAAEIALPADLAAYKLNCGQTGFYRVAYEDADNLTALGQKVREGALPHTDRWGLQNDLFALVCAGRAQLNDYLEFLRWYEGEAQYLPLASIGGHLHYVCAVVQGALRQQAAASGGQVCRQVLARIGLQPAAQEPHTQAALRNQMLWQAATWDVPEAVAFGVEQFEVLMAGRDIHPDIARSVMQVGAQEKGAAALQWFKQRFKQSPSEHERMNILVAMTSFRDWPLLEEALGFTLEAVPPRNQFIPIAAVAGNPTAALRMWDWYRQHLDRLETFHPLLYERVITGVVPLAGLGHEAEVNAFFQSYLEQRPHLKDAVALTLEHLEINSRVRAANGGADDRTPL